MTLSNWDTMTMDVKGKTLPGEWTSPGGVKIEFYKNWIHIHDEKGWQESEASYTKPIVMHVTEGVFHYKDVQVVALRGPQSGIFAAAWHTEYAKQKKGSKEYIPPTITGIIGCGLYGYTNRGRWIGVTKTSLRWFMKQLNKQETSIDEVSSWSSDTKKTTYKKYKTRSHVLDVPDEFRKLNLLTGERYNQGDAFFAVRGIGGNPATKIGKQKKTTFSKLIGG